MLGLVDGKLNRDTDLAANWSCNGFWGLWKLFSKKSLVDGYCENHNFDIWHGGKLMKGDPPSMQLIPGSYRCHIEPLSDANTFNRYLNPPPPPPVQRLEQQGNKWASTLIKTLEAVILCPGDRIIQRYHLPQTYLEALHPGFKYELKLKDIFCRFWRTVSDTKVRQSSIRVPSPAMWPDNGPIHFEIVSEVASTLRCIFERKPPEPFSKLPLELREEVYEYLRFKERARYTDFLAKP